MYKKLLIIQILFTFAVSVFSFTPDRIPLIEEKPDDVNIISSENFDIEVKLPFNASSSQTDGISFLPVESFFECFNTASGVFDSFVIEGGTCFQQHISPWIITPEYMSNILNHKFIHATNEATDSFERYLCENSNFSLKLLSSQQLSNWNNPNNPISTTGEFNVTITKGLLLIYSGVIDFGASINVPISEADKYTITTTFTGGNGLTIMTSSGRFYVNNQVSFDYYSSQSNNEDFIENSDQSVEGNERIKMRTGLSVVPSTLSINCPVRIKVISAGVMNNNSSTTPSKLIMEYPFMNVFQIFGESFVEDFCTGVADDNGNVNINMGRWDKATYTGVYVIHYNDYSWEQRNALETPHINGASVVDRATRIYQCHSFAWLEEVDDIRYRNFYQGNDPNRKRRVTIGAPNDFQGLHETSQATSNTKTACLFNENGINVHSMLVSEPSEDNPDEHIYLSKVGDSALYSHQLNAMKNYYEVLHNSTLTVKHYDKICTEESADIPIDSKSWLSHNYPNPFNPTTTISYNLKVGVSCPKIKIYNVKGQLVRTIDLLKQPGENKIIWDGTNNNHKPVSSGTYFYSLYEGNKEINTSKMLLIK